MYDSEEEVEATDLSSPERDEWYDRVIALPILKSLLRLIESRLDERRGERISIWSHWASRLTNKPLGVEGVRVHIVYRLSDRPVDFAAKLIVQVFFMEDTVELTAFVTNEPFQSADAERENVRIVPVKSVFTYDGERLTETELGGLGFLDVRPFDERLSSILGVARLRNHELS